MAKTSLKGLHTLENVCGDSLLGVFMMDGLLEDVFTHHKKKIKKKKKKNKKKNKKKGEKQEQSKRSKKTN